MRYLHVATASTAVNIINPTMLGVCLFHVLDLDQAL